jgi:hypothetical protein
MNLRITILCTCGKELEAKESHLSRGTIIEVKPCPDCLKIAAEKRKHEKET